MPGIGDVRGHASGAAQAVGPGLREGVRATLTRLSRTGELPTLPPAAMAAMAIARDPEAGVDALCHVIRRDVGLSARILRVANSAAYARRVSARTLLDAVLTLGLRKTCDLLVAANARQLFRAVPRHAERLWNHALAAALAAEEVARETRALNPYLVFLPGLFHDVGRIAFLLAAAEGALQESDASASAEPHLDRERAWYGFDHAEAGAILAEDWGLAHDQVEAIRWHHQPGQAEGGHLLAAVLNVADAIAYAMGFPGAGAAPEEVGRAVLGLTAEQGDAIVARARAGYGLHEALLG
ncbi:MAG: HDOD domain-containing protein [Candidatus Binatia bacterium]